MSPLFGDTNDTIRKTPSHGRFDRGDTNLTEPKSGDTNQYPPGYPCFSGFPAISLDGITLTLLTRKLYITQWHTSGEVLCVERGLPFQMRRPPSGFYLKSAQS